MRRGTTPTLKIRVKGVNLSELENIYITVKQDKNEITKSGNDVIVDGEMLYISLSQEDTLTFGHSCAWVQMRAMTKDGLAVASDIRMIKVGDILKDGVIT